MKIELNVCESEVILQILKKERDFFISATHCSVPLCSYDEKEEKRYINKMLKSFDRLIDYYGGSVD